jgi:hypothetical protein
MKEVVSGVGANAKRTDRNLSQRTQKIQREAKLQNASGGAYGERSNLEEMTKGKLSSQTESAASANPPAPKYTVQNAFAPGNPATPLTDGAGGNTAGRGPDALDMNSQSMDAGSILVRAMYLAYPTPEMRRYVEAYNQDGMTGLI